MNKSHQITNPQDIQNFIFGGNAIFTLKSKFTGSHMSFLVKASKDRGAYFVRTWRHGDMPTPNSKPNHYIGYLRPGDTQVRLSAKASKEQNKARDALNWLLLQLAYGSKIDQVEFYHSGTCCRCNRTLTDPTSIEMGIGPECRKKV